MSAMNRALATAFVCLFAAGCVQLDTGKAQTAGITLQPMTYRQWQEKLAGYRGNVVVVDFWATWCAPCVQRFPHLVELSRKYGGRSGIKFISMSLDDRSDPGALEQARRFLIQQNATLDNYRMDEIMTDAFDKLDIQGIPAVFIYDREGNLRYRLTGDDPNHQFTNDDVDRAVETLLAGESGSTNHPADQY